MSADPIDEIFARFAENGDELYIGEPVTIAEHMLQTAALARDDDAPAGLVAAALLHDYGHLLTDLPEDSAEHGVDTQHEELGFAFLESRFPPEVTEPIRLHVSAKRYLCAVDPNYLSKLSEDSARSLVLQGGPMSADEVSEFQRMPYYDAAVRLRRYDDLAKNSSAVTPGFEHFLPAIDVALSTGPAA